MGRSRTPKYALRIRCGPGVTATAYGWDVKLNGRPTAANLAAYVEASNASLAPGGTNHHLARAFGDAARIVAARIVLNDGGDRAVAEWRAPLFQVVSLPGA